MQTFHGASATPRRTRPNLRLSRRASVARFGALTWPLFIAAVLIAGGTAQTARAEGFRGGVQEALGPRFGAGSQQTSLPLRPVRQRNADALGRYSDWHDIALNASGLDHTPPAPGESRVFGEQLGPGRSSRAMAIIHLAMYDAVVALSDREHTSFSGIAATSDAARSDTTRAVAIAQAAHDTLAVLFPSQSAKFDQLLAEDLTRLRATDRAAAAGIDLGRRVAAAVLAARADDGSNHAEPRIGVDFFPSTRPGKWRADPISQIPLALGARWGSVKPFVLRSGDQFRAAPPPALDSAEYARAFEEAKRVGGDGTVTPSVRSGLQTTTGIFWAYDGTPSLCAPPRLYNQIATTIADQMNSGLIERARLLALVNVAMADTAIAVWESKYRYQVWRPVTGIREADAGSGPSGLGDGNAATLGDPTFTPLGAPASNLSGPNFTPPFPAYPSGHAAFGAAMFQMLRNIYGTDQIAFTFVSDEFNGETVDNSGQPRPLETRRFASLSQAEEENGQSRIYLGIHWAFDKTAAIAQGRRVANYAFRNALTR